MMDDKDKCRNIENKIFFTKNNKTIKHLLKNSLL